MTAPPTLRQRLALYVATVSGLPSRSSYIWGGYPSILTAAVLFITVIARLLSPLQHVKAAIRNQRKSRPGTNFRSDIPAFVSEVYFLISLLIVCTIYFTRPTNGPLVALHTANGCPHSRNSDVVVLLPICSCYP